MTLSTVFQGLEERLLEPGFTWLPAHLWRLTKFWRGLRMEVPWVDRAPTDIVRSSVHLATQPCDAPPTTEAFERLLDHIGSDEMLLFSTDYPHWRLTATPYCRKVCHATSSARSRSTIRG